MIPMAADRSDAPKLPASRELFEDWLEQMDDALEGFTALGLPDQFTAAPLSRAAMVQLEDVALSSYPDKEALVGAEGPWVESPEYLVEVAAEEGDALVVTDGAAAYAT